MRRAIAILLILISISLSGCSDSTGSQSASPQSNDSDQILTVYMNDFDNLIGPMFEAATGYKLNIVQGSGAEIMSRIQAERAIRTGMSCGSIRYHPFMD